MGLVTDTVSGVAPGGDSSGEAAPGGDSLAGAATGGETAGAVATHGEAAVGGGAAVGGAAVGGESVGGVAVSAVRRLIAARRVAGRRLIVGIAGPPGAGKSTLAESVVIDHPGAVGVPMDGFHLSNVELVRLGLADRKGAPETFDGHGFLHLLRRLRARDEDIVYAPAFSRALEESIGGAIPVPSTVDTIVVEGNYLLLPDPPWSLARELFDLVVYLDVPDDIRVPGLIARHQDFGRDEQAAREWVTRNDEANARLVAATRARADAVVPRA